MGRLFWKFFVCILLAQLTATIGIGGAVWLRSRAQSENQLRSVDTSPPAEMAINAAASTLEFGGSAALHRMLEAGGRYQVYAIDEQNHELLGREFNAATVSEARAMLKRDERQRGLRQQRGVDGKLYLLYLPAHGFNLDRPLLKSLTEPKLLELPGQRHGPDPRSMGGAPREMDAAGAAQPDHSRPPPPREGFDGRGGMHRGPMTPWIPLAAATLASLLFSVILAWYFSRPIRALRQAFDAAAEGDLAPRFGRGTGSAELNDLGRDFDRMTERLRTLIDGQTRLLHDVSHELRSPLARLQAAIGLAHQQPEKMAASMQRIELESVRMDKLVGELLTLSRLEAGAIRTSQEEVGMAELLEQITDDAAFEARSLQREVQLQGETDVVVTGQAELLARAIENVVRNAIKHSPEHGLVELQAETTQGGRWLTLRVLDRGPGVAEQDLDTIFQPFFRSSNAGVEGHGLGLAIARHVVEAHGGKIKATNREGGGLCVELRLPLKR
ncbi:HAMP domain-containing protein [Pseudoduganella sp. FT93W]|uniref:histidine kinase n=1 Tax=Duganella fentianensis TaxID=2692177 RepID=A0A845HX65_9BURK|nr:HAMP domain-containing protein [Duganella fentianensis]